MNLAPSTSRDAPRALDALPLGAVHALVDCASAYAIFHDVAGPALGSKALLSLIVLYNVLAFGTQFLLGLVADRIRRYGAMATAGILVLLAGLLLAPGVPVAAVALLGLGNALFHVGAGAHVLRVSGSRAAPSGVFVGPGAIGLSIGMLLGAGDYPARWSIAALLVLGLWTTHRWTRPAPDGAAFLPRVREGLVGVALAAALLLVLSVLLRSMVGGTVAGQWRLESTDVWAALALASGLGKIVGGFLGDRFGWILTSAVALLLSIPLLGPVDAPAAAVLVGMVVFQVTTPITLKGVHHLMPTRPGLAFGLPCLGLLLGALPGLLGFAFLEPGIALAAAILLSATLIVLGLGLLARAGASPGPRDAAPNTPSAT